MSKKITKILTAAAVLGTVGVSALPIAGYAADPISDSKNVSITVNVSDGLSLGCDKNNYEATYGAAANVTDSDGGVVLNGATMSSPGTCTVKANTGYTLTVADSDANTNLVSSGNTIQTKNDHAAGNPGWSISYSTTANSGALDTTKRVVPASGAPSTIADSANAPQSTDGDTYKYAFATSIAATTPAGAYTDSVTFTATGK